MYFQKYERGLVHDFDNWILVHFTKKNSLGGT